MRDEVELDLVEQARIELLNIPRGPIRRADEPALPGLVPDPPWADPDHDVLGDLYEQFREER